MAIYHDNNYDEARINNVKQKIELEYSPQNLTFASQTQFFCKFTGVVDEIVKEYNYDKTSGTIIEVEV